MTLVKKYILRPLFADIRKEFYEVIGVKSKGVKSIFPTTWIQKDIEDAGIAVLSQNLDKPDRVVFGVYKDVKVTVQRDPVTGAIQTLYPSRDQ